MMMSAAAAGGVGEVVNRVLEVAANPLKFHEYPTYPMSRMQHKSHMLCIFLPLLSELYALVNPSTVNIRFLGTIAFR